MDAVLLARLQFALTIGFHFLFPPTTLALTLVIVVIEGFYLKKGLDVCRQLSDFLIKILALVFVLGTATGIVMEFSFGNNWAEYSRMVGDIFGAPLAAEAIFAFFLESVFLGVLVFGRNRVSKRAYWWSGFCVFLGAHLSGFWIIVANSWMQTPSGFKMNGRGAVLTDFFQAVFNPSSLIRYSHTIMAGWITGSLLLTAIAAYYLLRNRFASHAKILMNVAATLFIVTSMAQLFLGHLHSLQVAKTQPVKLAAFEGLWQTQKRAPLTIWAIPDQKNKVNHLYLGFPGLLSFLIGGQVEAEIKGLDAFPAEEHPPILLTFMSYHVMIGLGFFFIGLALFEIVFLARKKIGQNRRFLKLMLFSAPLGYLACETGWIAAEVGRQPWAVYKILKTAQAVSLVVPAIQIGATLIVFTVVYIFLFFIFLRILIAIIQKGPAQDVSPGY